MTGSSMLPGLVLGLMFALGLALLILWVIVPFALFGLKGRLEAIREEQRRTCELLERVLDSAAVAERSSGTGTPAEHEAGRRPAAMQFPAADDDSWNGDRREEPRLPGVWER